MKMTCIIVDDEPLAREAVQMLVAKADGLDLLGSYNGAEAAGEFLAANAVDIIFLDIQMPGVNGIDFARNIPKETLVIFTTAFSEFATDSYEVDAIDYLIKPVKPERFKKAVEKAAAYAKLLQADHSQNNIENVTDDYVFIKADRKMFKVHFRNILFVEGLKDYVVMHTENQKVISGMNIKTIFDQLPKSIFVRVSKSYVININHIDIALQQSFNGNYESQYKDAGYEYDIMINLSEVYRSSLQDVKELPVTNSEGEIILLGQFAEITEGLGESAMQRIDRMAAITVIADVVGRPTGTVSGEIKEKVSGINLPAGISVEYLGETKNQEDAFGNLIIALVTAFVLVYLIMVALYENAVYPFVVLFSIPLAIVGALLALALSMQTINIFTIIGLIMLMGLVSKNAILIVDMANKLIKKGLTVQDALTSAGRDRLRPILMTTLSMILGMLPIALASGAASEMKTGMAWVIIGGLTSSLVLTLFVVPAIYMIAYTAQQRIINYRKQ